MLLTPITGHVTHGQKSRAKTNEMTCNQYKPNISVFICDTVSIKDNTIHEGDPYEAEYRFNCETYTPYAGAAGMLLHINGKFTKWKLKLSLIKKVSFIVLTFLTFQTLVHNIDIFNLLTICA